MGKSWLEIKRKKHAGRRESEERRRDRKREKVLWN